MKKINKMANMYVLKRFCLIFIPLFLLISVVTNYSYRVESENDRIATEANEIQLLDHIDQLILHDFKAITSDLRVMARSHTLQALFNGNSLAQARLADDWFDLAESKVIYDQIRFLNLDGQEIIRIDYHAGQPVIVEPEQLQNKKDRYYFLDTLKLATGEIFISPFDLNIEHGEIEQPLKPMIRFGAPVFDQTGQKRGIVLLNFLGEYLINWFMGPEDGTSQRQRMLLNTDGYWLTGPNPADNWGFMYGNDKTFGKAYPEAWAYIQANTQGQFVSEHGLFTFAKVYHLEEDWHTSTGASRPYAASKDILSGQGFHWIAVTLIPADTLAAANQGLLANLFWLFSFFTLMLGIVSWLLAVSWARRNMAFESLAKSEKELRKSSKRYQKLSRQFQGLLEGIEDFILIVDSDMKVIWSNNRQDCGEEAEAEGHTPLEESCTGGCTDGTLITSCFASGLPQQEQVTCSNGKSWMLRVFPVLDSTGKVDNAILIEQDITDFLQLQSQSIRTGQLAALGEMAAGVAHEINNPIGGVINYAQMLRNRSDENSETADLAARIMKEGERVARIVRTLLFCARENNGNLSPVSIPEVISEVVSLTRSQIEQAGIKLTTTLSDGLPMVDGHHQQLHQLFMNIISNARHALSDKYSAAHENNTLEITAERLEVDSGQYISIRFTDHGTGIPKDLLERVVSPFFTTKPAGIGTGLGLSISHEIVKKHHGRMNIESIEGEFTRVIIDLPVMGSGGKS